MEHFPRLGRSPATYRWARCEGSALVHSFHSFSPSPVARPRLAESHLRRECFEHGFETRHYHCSGQCLRAGGTGGTIYPRPHARIASATAVRSASPSTVSLPFDGQSSLRDLLGNSVLIGNGHEEANIIKKLIVLYAIRRELLSVPGCGSRLKESY